MSARENPYWQEGFKNHIVDKPLFIRSLLSVNSLIIASRYYVSDHYAACEEAEESYDPDDNLTLVYHHKNSERIITDLLLSIAVSMRTADDVAKSNPDSDVYCQFSDVVGERCINMENPTLRRACNKIIHAADLRFIYERNDDHDHELWYMTGEIELTSYNSDRSPWQYNLYATEFVEACFEWLEFLKDSD